MKLLDQAVQLRQRVFGHDVGGLNIVMNEKELVNDLARHFRFCCQFSKKDFIGIAGLKAVALADELMEKPHFLEAQLFVVVLQKIQPPDGGHKLQRGVGVGFQHRYDALATPGTQQQVQNAQQQQQIPGKGQRRLRQNEL